MSDNSFEDFVRENQLSLNKLVSTSNINLFKANIDPILVAKDGVEVVYDNSLVAYYYPDKFEVYSCFVSKYIRPDIAQTIFNKVAANITVLNPHISVDDLMDFLVLLADRYVDENGELRISDTYMRWWVNKVRSGAIKAMPEMKSYYWIGKYQNAGREFKLDVVRSFNGRAKRTINVDLVSKEIDVIQETGYYFITARLISNRTKLHINTVQKIISLDSFRKDIDEHNYRKFSTTIHSTYRKGVSIDRIVQSIDDYRSNNSVDLSKRDLAKKSGLHYQTVGNLWHEELVVEAYDRYNKWVNELKQIA